MKPDFDRVKTALSCEQPDRVPLAEVGIEDNIKEAFLGKKINNLKDEVEFWERAGYDYVLLGRKFVTSYFPGIYRGAPYKQKNKNNAWADESKGIITNYQDFEEYPWPNPEKADYKEFEEIGKILPKGMKAIAVLAPIYQYTWMLMGFESFSFALTDNLELIEIIMNKIGEIRLKVFETIINKCNKIGAVWMEDDLAYDLGLMIRPEFYRKYLLPWMKKIGKLCKQAELPFIFHSDGYFWELIDDLIDLGVNAIHPVEPKGMGKDVKELKEKIGNKVCLIGGIDLDVLIRGNADEVKKETINKLVNFASGGGYIAGSSNTVVSEVPVENYKNMIKTVLTYGKYPL